MDNKVLFSRLWLILCIVFAIAGIVTLWFGVSRQGPKQVGPTLQTTAVISDTDIEMKGTTANYWIYLDFSDSPMDPQLTWAPSERQQGIELREEDFNKFYVGQYVTIVYFAVESIEGEVCIESIDGCEAWLGSGDLTTPHQERSWNIVIIFVGSLVLVMSVLALFGYMSDISRRGKIANGEFKLR